EGGALLIDGCLVGRLLDAKQQVALLGLLTFDEIALLDEARHARDDVPLVDCRDPSDVIPGFRYLTAHHRSDRDGRRWGRILGGGNVAGRDGYQGGNANAFAGGDRALKHQDRSRVRIDRTIMRGLHIGYNYHPATCAAEYQPGTRHIAGITMKLLE